MNKLTVPRKHAVVSLIWTKPLYTWRLRYFGARYTRTTWRHADKLNNMEDTKNVIRVIKSGLMIGWEFDTNQKNYVKMTYCW